MPYPDGSKGTQPLSGRKTKERMNKKPKAEPTSMETAFARLPPRSGERSA